MADDAPLKPCCWCGQKPDHNTRMTTVWCKSPGCPFNRVAMSVEVWNQRPQAERLEKLEEVRAAAEEVWRLFHFGSLQTILDVTRMNRAFHKLGTALTSAGIPESDGGKPCQ